MENLLELLCIVFCMTTYTNAKELKEKFTWTRLSYVIPPNVPSNSYTYNCENNIPMGSNIWKNKVFLTVPRRRDGIVSTLNYVWLNSTQKHNVPLVPYPDFETNRLYSTKAQNLVSVYRTVIDVCDRLWMVDNGVLEIPGNFTRLKPSTVVIIDLKTDKIIKTFELPPDVMRPTSSLINIAVDVTTKTCGDAFAYIPDLLGYGLIVYSLKQNSAWRVTHNYFYLESFHGDFSLEGYKFQFRDGVFSVALSAKKRDGYRDVYFHSLSGIHVYTTSTELLRNQTLATRSYHNKDIQILGNKGPKTQSTSSAIHEPTGVYFYTLIQQYGVGCWNTNLQFKRSNLDIVYKNKRMIYPSDLKISGDKIVVLSNSLPIFIFGNLNYNEINFRVWISKVADAIEDTKCE